MDKQIKENEKLWTLKYNTGYLEWCKKRGLKRLPLKDFFILVNIQAKKKKIFREQMKRYFSEKTIVVFGIMFISGLAGWGYNNYSGYDLMGYTFSSFVTIVFCLLLFLLAKNNKNQVKN